MGSGSDGRGRDAFGPFISKNYVRLTILHSDIIVAGIVFAISIILAIWAAWIACKQTRHCRRPWQSIYVWMIWGENLASCIISILCFLFLLQQIQPSFYFYMAILFLWSIQVQFLVQIIVNRIRVILHDRTKGRRLIIVVAVLVTMINISVFCIWIPARLQVSQRYITINNGWDRTEKVIFFLIDGTLNWYFIRVVKKNLVQNGLKKYKKLVRFNEKIIVLSLLMDVLIIGAMSIPNGFVYAMFHPLAYLVKLIIEMTMANLIKKVAIDNARATDNISALYEFATTSFPEYPEKAAVPNRRSLLGLSFMAPKNGGIRKTEEVLVKTEPRSGWPYPASSHMTSHTRHESDERSLQSNDLNLVLPSVRNSESGVYAPGQSSLSSDEEHILRTPEKSFRLTV